MGTFRKLFFITSARRLEVGVFGLVNSRVDNDNAMKKYSCTNEQSRENLPSQIGSIFRPKLRIYFNDVAFLEMTL